MQPRSRAEPRREERLRIVRHELPSVQPLTDVFERGQSWRCTRRREDLEHGQHRVDLALAPGRRPVRVAQILEDEEGLRAVVPPHELGEERRVECRVEPVLVAKPARRELVERELDEDGLTVGELHPPADGVRTVAAADDLAAGDRRRARREGNLSRREALAQAGSGCRPDRRRRGGASSRGARRRRRPGSPRSGGARPPP